MEKFLSGLLYYFGLISTLPVLLANTSKPVNIQELICTQAKSPNVISQNSTVGFVSWSGEDNIRENDEKYAVISNFSKKHTKDAEVRLILPGGHIDGENKSYTTDWTDIPRYVSYGGDLWGLSLTSGDINNPGFGVAFRIGGDVVQSHYLMASDFGFKLLDDASVSRVTVEVKRRDASGVGENGRTLASVDHIRMTVCYTPSNTNKGFNSLRSK